METITLWRTGRRPLQFVGEPLAEYQTNPDRASVRWSGSTGRWTETRIYGTQDGRYVLSLVRRTTWQGERDQYVTWVLGSLSVSARFLYGYGPSGAG